MDGRMRWRLSVTALAAAAALSLALVGLAGARGGRSNHFRGAAARQQRFRSILRAQAHGGKRAHNSGVNGGNESDIAEQAAQYGAERTAPGTSVSGQALVSAGQQAAALADAGGAWQNVTTSAYDAEPSNYTDPFWSNLGAGLGLVGGRTTALAATADGSWWAGTADGGVWRSTDRGDHWAPVFDSMPSLSIGALAVDPVDGSLWVGTGEANSNQDSYAGTGIYRAAAGTTNFQVVGTDSAGNNPIVSHTVFQIVFDSQGNAYAATNNGLFRYATATSQWTEVLDPAGPVDNPPYDNQVTTVQIVPGTSDKDVIAVVGWRGGTTAANLANNGFYESTDGGLTFSKVTPTGDIDATDIGRTTFAYSADGKKLYAIVQSPTALAAGAESVLQGIFVSSGSPASVAGPWTKVADEAKLAASGSQLTVGSGYGVGVQAWYNQDLAVDPGNDNHVYAGLEEVFQSTDAGTTWSTASPYFDNGLACNPNCPKTTHPDQHAMMITGGNLVIGNDGGVYSRAVSDTQQYGGWTDLNATLASWQYYDARAGRLGERGLGVWGGLQDNGTSVLRTDATQMDEPAGGDGFDVIVDPMNANRMVGEYTDGTMYSSTNGGHAFNSLVSPGCVAQKLTFPTGTPRSDCDPAFRFVTPLAPDAQAIRTWVTGGEDVWVSRAGWNTICTATACSWKNVFDTGAGHAMTAVSSVDNAHTVYAAWVSGGGNPGPAFSSGIATNYGGAWHQISMAGLPNRYIAGITADPRNPAHAYAVFNGFSRRWIPGGGVGHVFETYNGGKTWTDISANLPDIASDALVLRGRRLALATDAGMYTARAYRGRRTVWKVLGTGLPNAAVDDVTPGPDGYIYAATHGRGIWRLRFTGR